MTTDNLRVPMTTLCLASHHDDVVPGHVLGQLVHVTPVGGLLVGDGDARRQHVQRALVHGQGGRGVVGAQQQHPLHPRLQQRQVELRQRVDWLIQRGVDQVNRALLTE